MKKISTLLFLLAILTGCSTTSSLEPDEQLYTGMKKIKYQNYEHNDHFTATQEEMEYALATKPNGALFGSSYYRTPFPYALWIWNAMAHKNDAFSKWMVSSFGKPPVIMSEVNPELRASVAQSVLQNHGYFRGKVDYDIIEGKPSRTKNDTVMRPRTAKIAYTVDMGHLFTLDSISYRNFPEEALDLINGNNETSSKPLLNKGDAFDISVLDAERTRISNVFRNNGYYFYQPSYTSYYADTLQVPGKVQLRMHLTDSLPEVATKPWVIGRSTIELRERYGEVLENSLERNRFTMRFNGNKPKIRPRVIFNNMKLRRGKLYSQDLFQESFNNLTSTGIFSSLDFKFTPAKGDTLDMLISGTLEKPYDFTLEANYLGKTSNRMGPGLGMSFAKRNAFRGGEVLSFNLNANYEFQTGASASTDLNSYTIGGDVALEIPRLFIPFYKKRHRWQTTPTTLLRVAAQTISRGGFFRRNVLSGEITYTFQPTIQSRHQFSPLIMEYDYLASSSDRLWEHVTSPYLRLSLQDRFIPKMRYTYTYTSPVNYRHPIFFSATLSESANLISLARMSISKKWNDKDKTLFNCPYSQFVKFETAWKKTWRIGDFDDFVAHISAGVIVPYGNSEAAPITEMFYVGGANDMRAFGVRNVGPGSYGPDQRDVAYVTQTGDMKFVANFEYRPRLFGSLYGALFCDIGNVWRLTKEEGELNTKGRFEMKNLLNDLAVGVGAGIRYDLDFFVLRLDWGFALHTPYPTSRSGYFNIDSFKNGQCLNFAIGYPF